MYKLLYCLSKKCIFNGLELEYQGQMAHVSSIALFITIFRFLKIFHFGRNGVKFHKSLLLKHHTCTQHIGDHNFKETIASAPGQYMLERYYKKIHLAELGAIYQIGEFFKIFKAQYLCYF